MGGKKVAFRLWMEATKKGKAHYEQCREMDLSPSTFSEILNRRVIPTPEEVEKLVAYYGVPGPELLPGVYEVSQKIHGEK